MDLEEFWRLIDLSRRYDNPYQREDWLRDELGQLAPPDVEDFAVHLHEERHRADTFMMWGAAYSICDGLCSHDGFWYFQAWLVGRGRDAFEWAVADPDGLVDLPEIRRLAGRDLDTWEEDEWPAWEGLDDVADDAHTALTGTAESLEGALLSRGCDHRLTPEPTDQPWDIEDADQLRSHLPRVAASFPLSRGHR